MTSETPKKSIPGKKQANIFIACFLAIITIDAIPLEGRIMVRLKREIDPIIDFLGIWQGSWDLFAPNVDKENHRIVASLKVTGDPALAEWRSPEWHAMGCFEKFTHSREIEFFDRIRNEENGAVWSSFARFVERDYLSTHPEAQIEKIELFVISKRIPAPGNLPLPEKRRLFYAHECIPE